MKDSDKLFDVIGVDLATHRVRIMATDLTAENAEAFVTAPRGSIATAIHGKAHQHRCDAARCRGGVLCCSEAKEGA